MMETDNPFEKVLDRLREKGWMKNRLGTVEGPNCIKGALWYETNRAQPHHSEFLRKIVLEQYPTRSFRLGLSVPSFNNHPDTTFADVERVLEKAAVKWEEERVLRAD